tara:strand:+ start:2312 stop:2659 length:348 start_codon:yes stop_codon:yes gene_type:complete
MPKHPDFSEEDDFSLMVDPFTKRVALVCPAPIIAFESLDEFSEWLNGLLEAVPQLASSLDATPNSGSTIDKDYASTVIETWQTQIMESLKETQKPIGRKKSEKKQKSSMNEEPNS